MEKLMADKNIILDIERRLAALERVVASLTTTSADKNEVDDDLHNKILELGGRVVLHPRKSPASRKQEAEK